MRTLFPGSPSLASPQADAPLRVMQLIHSKTNGGRERQVLSLSLGLQALGHEVWVATPAEGWLAEQARAHHLRWLPVRLGGLYDLWAHLRLQRQLRHHQIELVHAHTRRSARYAASAAQWGPVRAVATVHSLHGGKGYGHLSQLVAVSHAVRQGLMAGGWSACRVNCIPNGIEAIAPVSVALRTQMRRALGLLPQQLALVTSGRLIPDKGLDVLLQALACLPPQVLPPQVFVLGHLDTEWARRMRAQALALGVQAQVQWLGQRADVVPWLQAMDVFVQPSRSEALSLAVLEAMAVGLPVVAARTGGIPELVEHERTGLLFIRDDVPDLVEQLLRCCNAQARAYWGQQARQRQRERFSQAGMAQATVALYRQLCRATRPAVGRTPAWHAPT